MILTVKNELFFGGMIPLTRQGPDSASERGRCGANVSVASVVDSSELGVSPIRQKGRAPREDGNNNRVTQGAVLPWGSIQFAKGWVGL